MDLTVPFYVTGELMIGILDVGGGMRCVFSAGVYDYFLDNGISFDYYLGVSAGSANLISYYAEQRGRNLPFYTEYCRRKESMSLRNFLSKGSYLDLDYIYSTLCNEGGEYPLDFDTVEKKNAKYTVLTTDAVSGKSVFFEKDIVKKNNLDVIKSSCCLPVFCKPYKMGDGLYYDGGVSEPVPYEKAFSDGCDKIVVVLTLPKDYRKQQQNFLPVVKYALKKYPRIYEEISDLHERYNKRVEELIQLEKAGKVIILAPEDTFGVNTLTNDRRLLERLYETGYEQAGKYYDILKSIL